MNTEPWQSAGGSGFDKSLLEAYGKWKENGYSSPPASPLDGGDTTQSIESKLAAYRDAGKSHKTPNCLTHENDLAKETKTILELISSSISLPDGVASPYKASDICFVCVEFKRGTYRNYLTVEVGLGYTFSSFSADVTLNLVEKHIVSAAETATLRFSLDEFRSIFLGPNQQIVVFWIIASFV